MAWAGADGEDICAHMAWAGADSGPLASLTAPPLHVKQYFFSNFFFLLLWNLLKFPLTQTARNRIEEAIKCCDSNAQDILGSSMGFRHLLDLSLGLARSDPNILCTCWHLQALLKLAAIGKYVRVHRVPVRMPGSPKIGQYGHPLT